MAYAAIAISIANLALVGWAWRSMRRTEALLGRARTPAPRRPRTGLDGLGQALKAIEDGVSQISWPVDDQETHSGRRLRCASCGWSSEVFATLAIGPTLAKHLAVCPTKDTERYVPRWTLGNNEVWECAWTTVDQKHGFRPFTERDEAIARTDRALTEENAL